MKKCRGCSGRSVWRILAGHTKEGQINKSVVSLEIDNNVEFPLWNTSDSSILTFFLAFSHVFKHGDK